jgi:hypothetical protein
MEESICGITETAVHENHEPHEKMPQGQVSSLHFFQNVEMSGFILIHFRGFRAFRGQKFWLWFDQGDASRGVSKEWNVINSLG